MKKLTVLFFILILLTVTSIPYSYAFTVTLDGIANAGSSPEGLAETYLNVWDRTNNSYYSQWQYGDPTALQWDNIDNLVADLNTKGFAWQLESGGDPFNSPADQIWVSHYFDQGYYEINLSDNSSAYNLEDYWGQDSWNAYVQIWAAYDDNFNFGEGSTLFSSEDEALSYYNSSVDGMVVYLQEDTNLFFYINDTNSIDNFGSVTLNITSIKPIPEPATALLLGSGLVLLFVWRKRQNKNEATRPA